MTNDDQPEERQGAGTPRPAGPPVFSSRDLLAGQREAIIEHGQDRYRLRLTNSNKLILVK